MLMLALSLKYCAESHRAANMAAYCYADFDVFVCVCVFVWICLCDSQEPMVLPTQETSCVQLLGTRIVK